MRANFAVGTGIIAGITLLVLTTPARAHHAFAAEFDDKKPIHFADATVTRVELINPHSWIHVDVKQPDGTVENWAIEAGSPNILLRRGITRETLKTGQKIVVDGYQAKDGTRRANGRDLTLPNGQKLFLGSSGDTGAPYEVPRPGVDVKQ
ncbi:MAG: hypothetical protein JO307_12170 [Bryobacterales bacterium]|nr:hypothetical protein [Bryobacterales bacterium]MBV9398466.1 hypothetical protein [Bryobacterales bacterium]